MFIWNFNLFVSIHLCRSSNALLPHRSGLGKLIQELEVLSYCS